MDLYQLRYFLEVARTGGFTRAAESLHVSTPAVSRSVALLERSLGRKLFVRDKRRVSMTADGIYLKEQAARVYDMIEGIELEFEGRAPGGPAFLRIGSREMITNYLLPASLAAFRRAFPETRFGLHTLGIREMVDALKKDWLDFGFYHHGEVSDRGIEIRRLGAVCSHVYAARSLLPRGRAPMTVEGTLKLPFIAPRFFRGDPSEPSADGFPDKSLARDIRFEGEYLATHRSFVLAGMAAGVLPDLTIRDEWRRGRVVRLPAPPLGREIYFLKRRGRPLPRGVDLFLTTLVRTIRSLK